MEEQPSKSGLSTSAVIGIALIIAIVFGGGVYAYMNRISSKDKEALNAQITQLQNQVSGAKTAIITSSSSSTSTNTASSTVPDSEATICKQIFPNSKIGGPENDANASIGDEYCRVTKTLTEYATGGSCTAVEVGAPGETLGCPGASWIARKINGKWTKLAMGQDAFPCDILRDNDFPKSLLGNDGSCANSSGKLEQYSD